MFIYPNKPIRIYDIQSSLSLMVGWMCQAKMNGKRVLPYFDGNTLTLFGRQGQKFKETCPELKTLQLPTPWLLDGELLRSGRIFLWDYAIVNGNMQTDLTYQERWRTLVCAFERTPVSESFSLIPSVEYDQYETLLKSPDNELEGLVWKNPQATNLWGIHSTSEVNTQIKWRKK